MLYSVHHFVFNHSVLRPAQLRVQQCIVLPQRVPVGRLRCSQTLPRERERERDRKREREREKERARTTLTQLREREREKEMAGPRET